MGQNIVLENMTSQAVLYFEVEGFTIYNQMGIVVVLQTTTGWRKAPA